MHINYFAPHFPHLSFHPSDLNEHALENIMRVTWENEVTNVTHSLQLDLTREETWPHPGDQLFDVIFVINIFQVAPISVADGMMKCAAQLLHKAGSCSFTALSRIMASTPRSRIRSSTR